jgi:hypothetical protein
LGNEGQAVQHEGYDASQDKRDYDNDETPSPDFKFFSGQTTLVVLVVLQFVSPIQGLLSNRDSLV